MGCDSTEISSGSSDISPERIVELITEAKSYSLRVFVKLVKNFQKRTMKRSIQFPAERIHKSRSR